MRSRLFSFAPSLRIDAQLEMLTQEVLRYLLLVLPRSGILIPCSTGPPHDGTRQQDQVGWSEGGPHIVNQLTFVISVRERLQTHWHEN